MAEKPKFQIGWACASVLYLFVAGFMACILIDGYQRGEMPSKSEPDRVVRKIGREAEFDLAGGKFALGATVFLVMSVHAAFKAFGRGDDAI